MKNKKIIIAVVLLCVLGIVGATLAYFNTTDQISNAFRTRNYRMEVIESFSSPDYWSPGDTTPKTVRAINKGNVDTAVRISFEEEWKDAAGNTLPLKYNGTDYASIINFTQDYGDYWIKKTQNSVDYYYYKYKVGKHGSTVSLIDSVTFNPSITSELTHNCSQDNSTNTQVCSTRSSGYVGGTYKLTIKIETIDYALYQSEWNTDVEVVEPAKVLLSNHVASLIGSGEVVDDDPDNNPRYIGEDPNNYVNFNNEIWRMIGVFDGRVKLVRYESLGDYSWDSSSANSGSGINEWSQADLMTELNGDYLNNSLSSNTQWYNGYSNYRYADFDYTKVLKPAAQNLIDDAVWYLGSITMNGDTEEYYAYKNITPIEAYYRERNGFNNGTFTDNVTRTHSWTGKVGLIYPSDFYYSTSNTDSEGRTECLNKSFESYSNDYWCYGYSWLYSEGSRWTITPFLHKSYPYSVVRIQGAAASELASCNSFSVYPSVYLKDNVLINDGVGTLDEPFTLTT